MPYPTDEPRSYRGLLLGIVPAAALLALVGALALRRSAELPEPLRHSQRPVVEQPAGLPRIATPAPRPQAAPESVIAEKTQEARIRTTYMNFRTALATGNVELRRVLEPVLLRDRPIALKMAREELSRATEPLDQTIARQMVEALGN